MWYMKIGHMGWATIAWAGFLSFVVVATFLHSGMVSSDMQNDTDSMFNRGVVIADYPDVVNTDNMEIYLQGCIQDISQLKFQLKYDNNIVEPTMEYKTKNNTPMVENKYIENYLCDQIDLHYDNLQTGEYVFYATYGESVISADILVVDI